MDLLQYIGYIPTVLEGAGMIVGGFAVLATITPNDSDNKLVAKVQSIINMLGANFGNAKNA